MSFRPVIAGMVNVSGGAGSVAAITSGTITGITDLAIADGGTGASTAADARTNLGLTALSTTTPGTGVATALGVALGSAGSVLVTDYAADAGASDTYAATLSPAPAAYVTGAHYRFKANTANTGAATINFNSLGAKTIVKVAGGITTALADNDIRAGQWVDLVYDGTNMQMQSLLGNAPSGSSSISTPHVYYVETTGNNGTAEVGNPAKPYSTVQAAYDAGVAVSGVDFVIKLGVGTFTLTLTANLDANCIKISGCGANTSSRYATYLFLLAPGTTGNDAAGGNGYDFDITLEGVYGILESLGGNAVITDESEHHAGAGGNITVQAYDCLLSLSVVGGDVTGNGFGNGGNAGTITVRGAAAISSAYFDGGVPGGGNPAGTAGSITADNCDFRLASISTAGTRVFGRCSYTTGVTVDTDKGGNAAW